ncbi:MAG TPA: XRE family transcriptional regulator [Ruminococcaceae bacterium]|jgi:transcriptional regulator with XRE-family HTH domain|nr:XRE family transcriptional regulator [Oscillospiraceae bacterium]
MIYSRIRDLWEDRDLKQQDLADYLNCSQVCYSRYENGQRDIPLETISKIADFYNVSVDYLLNRTDCPDMMSD